MQEAAGRREAIRREAIRREAIRREAIRREAIVSPQQFPNSFHSFNSF
jgi:hypothetical protein